MCRRAACPKGAGVGEGEGEAVGAGEGVGEGEGSAEGEAQAEVETEIEGAGADDATSDDPQPASPATNAMPTRSPSSLRFTEHPDTADFGPS